MRTLVLSALLVIAFPLLAASAPLTFEEADTDGDGLISADEAASVEGLDFDAADTDSDGTLTVDEYEIAVKNLSPSTADSTSDTNNTNNSASAVERPSERKALPTPAASAAPSTNHAGGSANTSPMPTAPPSAPAKP